MIGYVIQCFNNLAHIPRLIDWIYDEQNTYVVSVNPASTDPFDLTRALDRWPNVHMITSIPVTWGGESLVIAMLDGLNELLHRSSNWRFAINLSETDFPLTSQHDLFAYLKTEQQKGITDHISDFGRYPIKDLSQYRPTMHYENVLHLRPDVTFYSDVALHEFFSEVVRSPIPDVGLRASLHSAEGQPGQVFYRPLHRIEAMARTAFFKHHPFQFGRLWFCLSRTTVEWFSESGDAATIFESMKHCSLPDEAYVQTAMLSPQAPFDPNSIARVNLHFNHGGPGIMSDADLPGLMGSDRYFARKLTGAHSPRLMQWLDSLRPGGNG